MLRRSSMIKSIWILLINQMSMILIFRVFIRISLQLILDIIWLIEF